MSASSKLTYSPPITYTKIMDIITWLAHEQDKRGWDAAELAKQADLTPAVVAKVLASQQPSDFEFCYGVAQALGKQPERLLNMAGLLSNLGLKLANELAWSKDLSIEYVRRIASQLSVDERRLIVGCADRQGVATPIYNEIRPRPDEFNRDERRQDRIRFTLSVLILVLILTSVSLVLGLILLI